MSKNRFIKTKSNYTFKKKHLSTDSGDIFERDYMTIIGEGEGNFKFADNSSSYFQMRRRPADINDLGKTNIYPTSESVIKLKPNYESLKDFAFYGSAVELIRSSVNNIITYFPAAISCTGIKNEDNQNKVEYFIRNDFDIDVFSDIVYNKTVDNDLRYFYLSSSEYVLDEGGELSPLSSWSSSIEYDPNVEPSTIEDGCPDYGTIYKAKMEFTSGKGIELVKRYDFDNNVWVYSANKLGSKAFPKGNWLIRLNDDLVKEGWEHLSEFQKILLNKDTEPIFTSFFKTPIETDKGIIVTKRAYSWPSFDGWNPDVNTVSFKDFISSLYILAEYYDKNESDNIWRSMTHESIKGLDWTFIRKNDKGEGEEKIDTSRVKPFIRIWGRLYDDIKRYVDTIGYTNNITYDEKQNLPDYCLTDSLELSGWDIRHVAPIATKYKDDTVIAEDITIENLYDGIPGKMNCFDCSSEFFKRLKIDSKQILSKKGTKEGIREVLSLFGMTPDDYSIFEFYRVAKPLKDDSGKKTNATYPLAEDVIKYNMLKDDYRLNQDNKFYGLPVKGVSLNNSKKDYVIPWFNNGSHYDGDTYFQMKGGWGKQKEKTVINPVTNNPVTLETTGSFTVFDETFPIIKVVHNVMDLGSLSWTDIKQDDIVYVDDLSDMMTKYVFHQKDSECIKDPCGCSSHYFILNDKELHYSIGFSVSGGAYGWKNIPISAFDESKWTETNGVKDDVWAAKRVIYLESLKDDTEGNNPHNGFGNYDSGDSFYFQFNNLLPRNKFSFLSDNELKELESKKMGFDTSTLISDDSKCYYFRDMYEKEIFVPKYQKNDKYINLFNPENDAYKEDEAAANSIINSKNLLINFKLVFEDAKNEEEKIFNEEYKKYIKNIVLFYVKQVVPSTAILEYSFGKESGSIPAGSLCSECNINLGSSSIMGVITNE